MRIEIRVLICLSIALLLFSIAAICNAQTNANGSFTNGSTVLTISNGVVVSTAPIPSEPVLVSTNGQVIPSALVAALAEQLGLPVSVLQAIPIKYLFWLGMFVVVLPAVAQKVLKFVPADLLVNKVGVWISHAADVKNPTIASLAAVAKQVENVKENPAAANSTEVSTISAQVPIAPAPAAPIIKA